jgi:CTP synthase
MRLGAQPAKLAPGSRAAKCYGACEISERHRHRYEFNNAYREQFAAHGMQIVGTSPDGGLAEIVEIPDHPWFVAVQFHPEFKSQPTRPHPLFDAFVAAAVSHRNGLSGRAPKPDGAAQPETERECAEEPAR